MNRIAPWLVAILALILLYLIRAILPPFIIAAILAYILVPGVDALAARFRVRRIIVVVAIYLVLLLGLGALFLSLRPIIGQEIRELRTDSTEVVHTAIVQLVGSEDFEILGYTIHARSLSRMAVTQFEQIFSSPTTTFQFLQTLFQWLAEVALTFIALFYFLLDSDRLVAFAFRFVPLAQRPRVSELGRSIHIVLGQYLRGQLLLIAVMSAVTWIALQFVFHIRFSLIIAIATGFLEVIPLIGPVIAASIASFAALSTGGTGTAFGVIVFYTVLRQLEDQFIAPNIIGRAVELHPLATIFAVLAGGALAGPLGLILAVPTAAAVKIVLDAIQPPVDPQLLLVSQEGHRREAKGEIS